LARQLGAECGKSKRTAERWQHAVKQSDYAALFRRTRSDAMRPKIYSAEQWQALVEAAWRVRGGKMRAEFRALKMVGSLETFRSWIWRVRRHEAPGSEGKIA
jgi:hypothetical protein